VYVCSCFGITEAQVKQHADSGRCTPRAIASACKAGTDCGSCVRRIQALLGRGAAGCAATRTELTAAGSPAPALAPAPELDPELAPEPAAVAAERAAVAVEAA
jgi:bacterioferritin-associated ferredoxin